MLKNCQVVFLTRPQGVFFSGEQVTGRINISLEKHKKVQEIAIKVSGGANCRWSEHHGTGKNRRTVYYQGTEVYFETYSALLSSVNQPDRLSVLTPGVHSFDFTFTLPHSLPSSYEGTYGRIRYVVSVKASRPNRFDESHKVYFSVLSNVDLNMSPHLRIPTERRIQKSFSMFFSSHGQLDMNLTIPVSGFVPGENIPIHYVIHNNSKVKIQEIRFGVLKETTFTCMYPLLKQKIERMKVAQALRPGLGKGETQTSQALLVIPALPPSNPSLSFIIKINYFIKIKVVVSGMHGDVRDQIPIIIGSVPLHPLINNNDTNYNPSYGESSSSLQPTAPPAYSEFAPPTYQEAQGFQRMAEDNDVDAEEANYTPKYLFYPQKEKIGFV